MLACLAKPHPLFHISTSSVCQAQPPVSAAHLTLLSLIPFVCADSSSINHHVTRSNKQFLTLCRFLNDHGGWCRHTAKWWNGCLGVWGPADQSGPGKFCKEKRFKIHTLHSTFQSSSEVLLLRDACDLNKDVVCLWVAGVHSSCPGVVQQSHSHLSAVTQRSDGPSARGDPSCPALSHPVPTGPDCTGARGFCGTDCLHASFWSLHAIARYLQWSRCCFLWLLVFVKLKVLCLLQISTVAESEDSQESVDSVTDSQKRREILSRRPSYRSVRQLLMNTIGIFLDFLLFLSTFWTLSNTVLHLTSSALPFNRPPLL